MVLGHSAVLGQGVFRIRNWERLVAREKGGARAGGLFGRVSGATLGSVGGLKSLVRRRLLKLPHGLAAYGVWILLVSIAAESNVPGVFLDEDGMPLTVEDLALLTDVPLDELRQALETLARPEVRLIELVSWDDVFVPTEESVDCRDLNPQAACPLAASGQSEREAVADFDQPDSCLIECIDPIGDSVAESPRYGDATAGVRGRIGADCAILRPGCDPPLGDQPQPRDGLADAG